MHRWVTVNIDDVRKELEAVEEIDNANLILENEVKGIQDDESEEEPEEDEADDDYYEEVEEGSKDGDEKKEEDDDEYDDRDLG